MSSHPHTVVDVNVALDHADRATDLPMLRVGAIALFCSGPRRDGRFGLHRTSPSEPPFGFAWQLGGRWVWSDADESRHGESDSLAGCLSAANDA